MTAMVTGLDIAHRIDQKFPGAVANAAPEAATIEAGRLIEVCTFLRDDPDLEFKFLSSLTGVDCMDSFEIVYHLEAFRHNRITCIRVKTMDRENPAGPAVGCVGP